MHLDNPLVRSREAIASEDEASAEATETIISSTPPRQQGTAVWLQCVAVAVLLLGLVLRFVTPSALWLDEALTVDISRAPVHLIPGLLRHDGAPPLYYVMLHYWMDLFGQGNVATRSLCGVLGVANLPVAWLTGRRVASHQWSLAEASQDEKDTRLEKGRIVAWSVTLLLASSPFVVYYDTEARMYGLVILLGTLLVLCFTYLLERPTVLKAALLTLVVSALLYSHYWSLYAIAVTGVVCVWAAIRGPYKSAFRYATAAVTLGCLSWLPWLPIFLYQSKNTGTPWSQPAQLTAVIFAATEFAGGDSDPGRALALVFFVMALLAVAGTPLDRWRVVLDFRTRPGVRLVAFATLISLVAGVLAGRISGSAFDDRYTSAVLFPSLLVVSYGLTTLRDARTRNIFLSLAVVFGLLAAVPNAFIDRTQAGQVGASIIAHAHPADVVAYCPDQLGPAVSRVIDDKFREIAFPRGNAPEIVNWVHYLKVVQAASVEKFVDKVEQLAGPSGSVFYVWAPGYVGFSFKCQEIADAFKRWPAHHQKLLVRAAPADTPFEIFEGDTLDEFLSN